MKFWIGAKDPHTHRAMNSQRETAKSPDAYVQQLRAPQSAGRTKSPSRGSFQLFDSQPEYQNQQINQTLCPTAEFFVESGITHLILITAQGLVRHPAHVTEKDPEILLWLGR